MRRKVPDHCIPVPCITVRLDSGDDRRVDKEEFTSEKMKSTLEQVRRLIHSTAW